MHTVKAVWAGLYDFDEYKAMLESAGFRDIEDINNGPIKAKKPL